MAYLDGIEVVIGTTKKKGGKLIGVGEVAYWMASVLFMILQKVSIV